MATGKSWFDTKRFSARQALVIRVCANLIGALSAAYFAQISLHFYLKTHRLIGAAFLAEQLWIVVAYLARRPARTVSRRTDDWLLAFGGTFGGVLSSPFGAHPQWGVDVGLIVQLVGLAMAVVSFIALGRSFGFAAADRGLVQRGPYAVVRHPVYVSYLLLQSGYVLQTLSVRNAVVMAFVTSCNAGRVVAEERLLSTNEQYSAYRVRVRWRMIPGVW